LPKTDTLNSKQFLKYSQVRLGLLPLAACAVLACAANAQSGIQTIAQVEAPVFVAANSTIPAETLPDAPDAVSTSAASPAADFADEHHSTTTKMAGQYDKYIEPGQPVPTINAHDKFVLGVKDAVSPFSFAAWIVDAGYEQVTDSSPNYGHNRVAFAQRFGAGALRDITQGVLGDSVLAPILHEDPRYYKMGPGHSFAKRVVYAGTRAIITRKDDGSHTFNFAQVGGNLGGAILTNSYYPQTNRGFSQTVETFGGSVGGSALGFVVSEFLSGFLQAVHLEHHD
jgi:hypothetical protein